MDDACIWQITGLHTHVEMRRGFTGGVDVLSEETFDEQRCLMSSAVVTSADKTEQHCCERSSSSNERLVAVRCVLVEASGCSLGVQQ